MAKTSTAAAGDDKWSQLTDWAQLGVAVAEVLSLHQQLEHIQASSTFTAQRQPVSRKARPSAAFTLNDSSDAESEVDTDCDAEHDAELFSDSSDDADDGDDPDYIPSKFEGVAARPLRESRALRATLVVAAGRRSLAGKPRWELDPGFPGVVTHAPRSPQAAAHLGAAAAASGPRRSTRLRQPQAPPVGQDQDELSDGALDTNRKSPSRAHYPADRNARTKGQLGQWLASLPGSSAGQDNEGSALAPASLAVEGELRPVPIALPLADPPSVGKTGSKRRGKGQARRPRAEQSLGVRAHTLAKDKERKARSHAVKAALQKAQIEARCMSPPQRALHQMNGRAARSVLEKLAPVRSSVNLTKLLSGRSYFTGPSKFRENQLAQQGSGAAPVQLHSKCNRLVRNLVRREGYTYVSNDATKAQACFDAGGKMFAVKARQPQGGWYQEAVAVVTRLATDLREALHLADQSPNSGRNTRGKFTRFTYGTSFGGGQKKPTRISPDLTEHNERLIVDFLSNKDVQKVLKHVESVVFLFYPELAKMYQRVQAKVNVPDVLRKAGINLPFAAHTFNLGPYVTCWFHRDARNFILGICPVLVLGDFNHQTSGHFIMVEPRIVLELRPGDLLVMMSAVLTHGNAPLRRGETRLSWTFFTAGGLFRWVAAKGVLVADLPDEQYEDYREEAARMLVEAWDAIPTFEQLQARARPPV